MFFIAFLSSQTGAVVVVVEVDVDDLDPVLEWLPLEEVFLLPEYDFLVEPLEIT